MRKSVLNQFVKRAAWAVVMGLASTPAFGGDIGIDIRIGAPRPRPVVLREEVVIREQPVVYETYVVGYRRTLYDADLRLRIARADEWQAHEELDAARHHEGELAVGLDEQEAVIGQLKGRVGSHEESAAELHAKAEATAERAAGLRKQLGALEHRINGAREDLEASKTLHDRDGMADAVDRIKSNEARAAAAAGDLRDAEEHLAHLRREESEVASMAADRERLQDARARAGEFRHKLDLAHEAVYVTQNRLTAAQDVVFAAVHDRDEALWLLHRDEILAGTFEPERCGFKIDLSLWGGRMPRDPEVLHAYCVRDAGYYRSNPVVIEERLVIADRAPEIIHVREFQRVREVEHISRVEKVEFSVKIEDRRRFAEVAVVERTRFEAETVERRTAVAEHRAPRPQYVERPANVRNVNNVTNVSTVNGNVTNNNSTSNSNNNSNNVTNNVSNTVTNNVDKSRTVNKTTVVNNNVTNVTKAGADPKEQARLQAQVKRDESKLAEQSKQIEQQRQNDRKQAEEIAKIKADQERIDKKADRPAADKPVAKADKAPSRGEKVSEKAADKRDRPAADSRADADPSPRNKRGGAADSSSAHKVNSADSRDSKNARDPRAPRDGQASTDDRR